MSKYINIYNKLIEKARTRNYISRKYRLGSVIPEEEVETHHILPKSMGGSNSMDNLVVLTTKEHFIAHMILTKVYPGDYRMLKAFHFMCKYNPNRRAEDYRVLRENMGRILSEQAKEFHNKPESKQIISDAGKEVWKREGYRDKQIKQLKERNSPEYRQKLSIAQKRACEDPEIRKRKYNSIENHSKVKSKEWVEKIGKINKERMNRPEVKKESSEKYKGSNFDNSKKVIDIVTKIVYDSASDAAKARNLGYQVVKKWLYKKVPKHNLMWYEDYKETENDKIG